jgi:hypothetical protein
MHALFGREYLKMQRNLTITGGAIAAAAFAAAFVAADF